MTPEKKDTGKLGAVTHATDRMLHHQSLADLGVAEFATFQLRSDRGAYGLLMSQLNWVEREHMFTPEYVPEELKPLIGGDTIRIAEMGLSGYMADALAYIKKLKNTDDTISRHQRFVFLTRIRNTCNKLHISETVLDLRKKNNR